MTKIGKSLLEDSTVAAALGLEVIIELNTEIETMICLEVKAVLTGGPWHSFFILCTNASFRMFHSEMLDCPNQYGTKLHNKNLVFFVLPFFCRVDESLN